ncbi:hypothetical protein [Burkholderia ubonensis]|uniref:hypothetical protein n=1 Tax=Burkholderia ubonensis TaxID=101571 RepID=UPI0012FC793E|nr:hypothetical protein [Burkholderia ubonensis]
MTLIPAQPTTQSDKYYFFAKEIGSSLDIGIMSPVAACRPGRAPRRQAMRAADIAASSLPGLPRHFTAICLAYLEQFPYISKLARDKMPINLPVRILNLSR